MVFTGDHMNKPSGIDELQANVSTTCFCPCTFLQALILFVFQGVLSKARADDLRNMPLQETDLLLHEAGAPPIHTPLEVLMKLPQRVKKRLYVVHTSQIPPDCDLRVAPTGTAGTLRLDQFQKGGRDPTIGIGTSTWIDRSAKKHRNTRDAYSISLEDDEIMPSPWSSASNEYSAINEESSDSSLGSSGAMNSSFSQLPAQGNKRTSLIGVGGSTVPLVSLRPASSTDAWFILNLLSAVPFLSR